MMSFIVNDSLFSTVNRAQLAPFEAAQLANLCCEDPDEAKSLIPR
jgi:hypothetical protein